jgi:hypothetical protein
VRVGLLGGAGELSVTKQSVDPRVFSMRVTTIKEFDASRTHSQTRLPLGEFDNHIDRSSLDHMAMRGLGYRKTRITEPATDFAPANEDVKSNNVYSTH